MPKINVYLPEDLAAAVRDAQVPISAICQTALERAVRDVSSVRGADTAPPDDHPGLGVLGRFTPRVRQSLTRAEEAARAVPHNYVGTEHILVGMIDEGGNLAVKVLAALEIELDDLRAELVASMGPPSPDLSGADGHLPFTPEAKRSLEAATKEAMRLFHNYVGCEHLLLGLLSSEDGLAGNVLRRMGLELRTTRRAVVAALSGFVHASASPPAPPAPAAAPAAPTGDVLTQILARLEAIEHRLA